jgi:DNA (cytosine-5)-methyltransferase 1
MGKPRVISLFSGAGGLDHGLEAAGLETGVCVEMDRDCCETLRKSRAHWTVLERSIFDVPTAEMLEACGRKAGDVDLLVGGPPCQPFSKAAYWHNGDSLRLEDPRASTLSAFLRVVEEARPRAFLLENVQGLAYSGKDEGLRLLLGGIERINRKTKSAYRPVLQVLNAAEHGVPQLRERVFLVAARDGRGFRFPEPTHAEAPGGPAASGRAPVGSAASGRAPVGLEPFRSAWDALADVAVDEAEDLLVRGKWAELLPSIPEGQNYLWHTERGGGRPLFGWRRRFWTFLLKLAKDRPSWTIQAQPGPAVGPFHWQNRRLSMRELCRLQTFPDDVLVHGSRSAVQRQLGNAVPSLLAEVLGREIRSQLLGLGPLRSAPRLLLPRRRPIPGPEPVLDVPARFLALEGRHEAHPGTGKGRAARRAASSWAADASS